MAKEKKLVEAITSMDEDFAQWYTDVVKKAELIDYTSVKGCMAIKPAGSQIQRDRRTECIHADADPGKSASERKRSCRRFCTRSSMGNTRRTGAASGAYVCTSNF